MERAQPGKRKATDTEDTLSPYEQGAADGKWAADGKRKAAAGAADRKRKAAAGAADVELEGDTSGDVGTEGTLSEYEQQRLAQIARNHAVMVSLGIDCSQTRALPRGGAPASKPVPATNPGSGESTKRDKGKDAAEPAENARDTNGAGGSVTDEEEPSICIYIPTHPDDDFRRGNCVDGESSGGGCRAQKRPKTFSVSKSHQGRSSRQHVAMLQKKIATMQVENAAFRSQTGTCGEGGSSGQQRPSALRRQTGRGREGGREGEREVVLTSKK